MKTPLDLVNFGAQPVRLERTQHPRSTLSIAISPSKAQRTIELLAFLLGVVVLFTAKLPIGVVAIGGLALAGYAAQRARQSKNQYVEIKILPDDHIELRRNDELEPLPARISGRIFVSPAAVAFCIEGARANAIVLTSDQMSADQFRLLRVRLKHLREPN
jgi:hypothetical protein